MHDRNKFLITACILFMGFAIVSCNKEDNGLAPYAGSPKLSNVTVQDSSFRPRITWLGGYVSALGINRGNRAALDSTLVWLIQAGGNNIHYPVTFGQLPSGATDLTTQFGGHKLDSLREDEIYTFWILKDNVWNQISTSTNKILVLNDKLNTAFTIVADTILINPFNYIQRVSPIDVFINISNVTTLGKLAQINVTQTNKDNNPIITWQISQQDISDTLISALGVVEGQQYQVLNQRWSVWSEETTDSGSVFGKKGIISQPVKLGQQFPDSRVFIQYPPGGLLRNKDYYVWIANKDWNGEGRLRSTSGYAWATFHTY